MVSYLTGSGETLKVCGQERARTQSMLKEDRSDGNYGLEVPGSYFLK